MSTVDLYAFGTSFSAPYVASDADKAIAATSFQRRNTPAKIAKKSIDGAWPPPPSSAYSIGTAGTLFSNGVTTPHALSTLPSNSSIGVPAGGQRAKRGLRPILAC